MSLFRGVINGINILLFYIFVNIWIGYLFYIVFFFGFFFLRDKIFFVWKILCGMEGYQGGGGVDGEGWWILYWWKEGGVGER